MAGNGARYTKEQKDKAAELALKIGVSQAAKQLGIGNTALYRWVKEKKQVTKKIPKAKPEQPKVSPPPKKQVDSEPREFKRGQIYYVSKGPTIGSEQQTGRPAIIVSSDLLNQYQQTVEVVYLTTRLKPELPAYTTIRSSGVTSSAIGTQISTIDKTRLLEYIGDCTPDEMHRVEKCMLYSIGLENYETPSDDQLINRISVIKAERDAYKDIYDKLFDRFTQEVKKAPGK